MQTDTRVDFFRTQILANCRYLFKTDNLDLITVDSGQNVIFSIVSTNWVTGQQKTFWNFIRPLAEDNFLITLQNIVAETQAALVKINPPGNALYSGDGRVIYKVHTGREEATHATAAEEVDELKKVLYARDVEVAALKLHVQSLEQQLETKRQQARPDIRRAEEKDSLVTSCNTLYTQIERFSKELQRTDCENEKWGTVTAGSDCSGPLTPTASTVAGEDYAPGQSLFR